MQSGESCVAVKPCFKAVMCPKFDLPAVAAGASQTEVNGFQMSVWEREEREAFIPGAEGSSD